MHRQFLIAAAVFALALATLAGVRSSAALHPPYPRGEAVRAALRDPAVAGYLRVNPWTRAQVIALDQRNWRVTFSDGPHLLLDVAVGRGGIITATQPHPPGSHPAGSNALWTPAVLVLLAAVFFMAVAGWPLRRLRNLDALVASAGFLLSVLLYDARLIGPQVYVGDATLAYLALRLARTGFGRTEIVVVNTLYSRLIGGATARRLLPVVSGVLLVAGVVAIVTSTEPSDVAFAGLAGATLLNHGTVPYGHLPGVVVHGDTYPLLSYVLYMPFAAFGAVRDASDSLAGSLWLNAIAVAVGALLLWRRSERSHALAWLAFPPVLLAASGGGNDVPAAVLIVAAVVTFPRGPLSAGFLTLAAWVKIVPLAALVPWLAGMRPQPARQAALVVAALLALGVLAVAVIGGTGAIADAWHAIRFQFVRGSWYSVWQQTGTRWLQLVFQAGTIAFAAFVAVHLWRMRAEGVGLRRTAAFAGAIIALLQISANYWTYNYLPWLLPFILVALFPAGPQRSPTPAPRAP
jgi:hypothetical protein